MQLSGKSYVVDTELIEPFVFTADVALDVTELQLLQVTALLACIILLVVFLKTASTQRNFA